MAFQIVALEPLRQGFAHVYLSKPGLFGGLATTVFVHDDSSERAARLFRAAKQT